jgi:hypothetical protein
MKVKIELENQEALKIHLFLTCKMRETDIKL